MGSSSTVNATVAVTLISGTARAATNVSGGDALDYDADDVVVPDAGGMFNASAAVVVTGAGLLSKREPSAVGVAASTPVAAAAATPESAAATVAVVWLLGGSRVVAPDWSTARQQLAWSWLVHTYGFACLFFMLAFYAFFSILNLRAQLSARPYMTSINVFLCLLGVSRALSFLIDPYDSKGIMPETIGSILWDIAFPCLVSAFSLIQLAFIQLTQLKMGPSKLRNKSCLSLVVTTHFCLIIATNIILTFQDSFRILMYTTETMFLCWGTFISLTFLYGGRSMLHLLRRAPPGFFSRTDTATSLDRGNNLEKYKGVSALGLFSKCNNLVAATASAAATAAVSPSFLAPKIRITDENDLTYSYVSDNSHVSGQTPVDIESPKSFAPHVNGTEVHASGGCRKESDGVPKGAATDSEWTQGLDCGDIIEYDYGNDNDDDDDECTVVNGRSRKERSCTRKGLCRTRERNGDKPCRLPKEQGSEAVEMSLLPGSPHSRKSFKGRAADDEFDCGSDLTLMTILNHIAYVNQAVGKSGGKVNPQKLKHKRRSQIEEVLHATAASAILGLILCVLEAYRIFGPYGITAGTQHPNPWPWFIFQTVCRLVEFLMGCFMANITKQPVNRHHYPYSYYAKQRSGMYF